MSNQPSEGRFSLSSEARRGLSRYVWRIAVPRECAIVVLFNAPWAWLVFRGRDDITHLGWGGLMAFLGPMSFVLPFFTSFFGWMTGIILKPYFGFTKVRLSVKNWIWPASVIGVFHGMIGVAAIVLSLWGMDKLFPSLRWNAYQAVAIVSCVACLLATVFHPWCIRRSLQNSHYR
ncbi:MAG: hypothetical protein MUC43_00575 [Pirellula sp.]|nr:hypothetical protein [Pirellula sp.]